MFEITDLIDWLRHHIHVSGIQRVQVELVAALSAKADDGAEYVSIYRKSGTQEMRAIRATLIDALVKHVRTGRTSREQLDAMLARILDTSEPIQIGEGDVFFLLGAFWHMPGIPSLAGNLAAAGALVGAIIYDLIPVRHPEFSDLKLIQNFTRTLASVGPLLSFAFAISDHVARDYAAYRQECGLPAIPIVTMPLAVQLDTPDGTPRLPAEVAERIGTSYVLQVGTVEVRKNPRYALEVWRKLIAERTPDLPKLVYVGKIGWRVTDFLEELQAINYLDDRLLIVSGANDLDLWALYRGARFTLFPSFSEGWGLPVGESLAHGVPCICSDTASLPEVGGAFADYVDPFNIRSGVAAVQRMLDDEYRDARVRQIRDRFPLRSWREVAQQFHRELGELVRSSVPVEVRPAALAPGRLFGLGRSGTEQTPLAGFGWHESEDWGLWGAQAAAGLSMTVDTAEAVRIFLVMRTPPQLADCSFEVVDAGDRVLDRRTIARPGASFLASFDATPEADGRVDLRVRMVGSPTAPTEQDGRSLYLGIDAVGYAASGDLRRRQDLLEALTLNSHAIAPVGERC